MFNAWKEQTPLVFYAYRTEDSLASGRDGFEELPGQEQLAAPMTKLSWTARRAGADSRHDPPRLPRGVDASVRADLRQLELRLHRGAVHGRDHPARAQVDPRMRVRPNPVEVQRAAKLLVEARRPLLIVGDEIYKAKAFDKVVQLAELLALPVTQARSVHANFPQQHPLWVGNIPATRVETLPYPGGEPDVVINIGNKLQHNSAALTVPRRTPFIDMRNDSASIGNVLTTAAPLVADVAYGTEDLLAAVNDLPDARAQGADRGAARRGAGVQRAGAADARARVTQSVVGRQSDGSGSRDVRAGAVGRQGRDRRPRGRIAGDRAQLRVRPARRARAVLLLRRASRLGRRDRRRRAARAGRSKQVICLDRRRLVPLRSDGALEHGAPGAAGPHGRLQQPRLQRPAQSRDRQPRRRRAFRSTRAGSCTTTWANPTWTWPRSPKDLASTASGRRHRPNSRVRSVERAERWPTGSLISSTSRWRATVRAGPTIPGCQRAADPMNAPARYPTGLAWPTAIAHSGIADPAAGMVMREAKPVQRMP